ncbi:MAG: hypothetical protein IJO93_02415 [Clostridia bacterium]|nr:hypothetical protein [Clostridia bacterium]
MEMTVVLHGKYSGLINISCDKSGVRYSSRGIPRDSSVYLVSGDMAYRPDEKMRGNIDGVLVADESGRIIMEGRVRFAKGSNEKAKAHLCYTSKIPVKEVHSAALDDILKRAEDVFSSTPCETDKSHTDDNVKAKPKGKNPFSSTYPDSVWQKVQHKNDRAYHLSGTARISGETLHITAVPIKFYSEAYFMANGFAKIVRSDDGVIYRMRVERRK